MKTKFETTNYIETAMEVEKIIEGHDNKKMILRFFVCANYCHNLICVKSGCKIKQFINVVNIILLGYLPAEQKVQKFQDRCRINYKEFIKLHSYLRSRVDQSKKEIQEEKNGNKVKFPKKNL